MNNFGIPVRASKFRVTAVLLALSLLILSAAAALGQSEEYFYVRYNGNGADSGSISEEYVHGTEITLKKNEKTPGSSDVPYARKGCSFVGWSMKESVDEGLVEIIPGGEVWTVDDEAIIHYYNEKIKGYTLYAWWKCPEGITGSTGSSNVYVRYNGNKADRGDILRQMTVKGSALTVKDNADSEDGDLRLVKKDRVFAGWNTKADGSGDAYKPGDQIRPDQDMTLYAQWKDAPAPTAAVPLPTEAPAAEPEPTEQPSLETIFQNALTELDNPSPEPDDDDETAFMNPARPAGTQPARPQNTPAPAVTAPEEPENEEMFTNPARPAQPRNSSPKNVSSGNPAPRNDQFRSQNGRGFYWLTDYDFGQP